ncbi:molecular chaperone DnaJ [Erythrobacter alti]|uniref:molecular chaperone DnaJ n=1 Tax=Erythrobacter alti TaxID=1896145 RepID=UPI0030F406EF
MSTGEVDFYELLGVARDADAATLKSSYRKKAMKYHPDRNPGDADSEAQFKMINAAYEVLKDPQKRAAYDRYGHAAFQNGGPGAGGQDFSDLGDIFETIFGSAFGGGAGGGRARPRRGADLRYDMQITLDDAFHGKSTQIEVEVSTACETCTGTGAEPGTSRRRCELCHGAGKVRAKQGFFVIERPCPNCHGAGEVLEAPCKDCRGEGRVDTPQSLEVEIPAGVDNGTRIRMSGRGEAGPRGAPAGDLYIFVHVKKHDVFEREGTALFTQVPISFTSAALGDTIEIPGLDGQIHAIDIPAGIQSGKQLRKRGAGMPVLQGRGRGDMVVEVMVETPTRLSSRQKEILCEFRETETGEECPESRGFLNKIKDVFGV